MLMENIKVTFLGTGNAVPTETRNHSGILLSFANETILVDCGEGIQRQFRHAKLSPARITRILITHWHGDHILGLPGLFQTLAMTGYSKTLKLYGPKGTHRFMNAIKELMIDFRIPLEIHECSSGTIINEKDFLINAEAMEHGIPSLAYSLVIKDKRRLDKKKLKKLKVPNSPLLGQLQAGKDINLNSRKIKASQVSYIEKGKKLTIVMDTGFNARAIKLAENSDLLITESTFSDKESAIAKEYKHLTSKQAAEIARKAKAKRLILTHISQRYEHIPYVIEKEAKKVFKNAKIAKDLDTLEV
jgi:ribonuclease Z